MDSETTRIKLNKISDEKFEVIIITKDNAEWHNFPNKEKALAYIQRVQESNPDIDYIVQ